MEIHGYPWWIFHLFLYVYWRLKPAYLLALVGSHCFEGDLPPWRGQPGFYYGNHRCFWHFQIFDFLICSRNHYFNGLMVQYLKKSGSWISHWLFQAFWFLGHLIWSESNYIKIRKNIVKGASLIAGIMNSPCIHTFLIYTYSYILRAQAPQKSANRGEMLGAQYQTINIWMLTPSLRIDM